MDHPGDTAGTGGGGAGAGDAGSCEGTGPDAARTAWLEGTRASWLVLLFACIMAIAPAGDRGLFEPDEGRYAEIARTMLATGDWLTPRFQGHEHLTKPPFAYWATALGLAAFGVNVFGARFAAACAFLGGILATGGIARILYGRRAGLLASLIFATFPLAFATGHFVSTDVFVMFWQILGVWAAARAWSAPEQARPFRWCFWLAFGMAFFTKGPPGLLAMIPIAAVGVQRWRRGSPRVLWSAAGFATFLAVASWWFLVQVIRDPSRWRYFLVDETYGRIATDQHHRETTRWIYVGAFVAGVLPWLYGYVAVLARIRAFLRSRPRRLSPGALLIGAWILPSLAIFNLARSRLVLYVVPLLAPLAVAFAACFAASGRPAPRWGRLAFASWCGVLFVLNHLAILAWPAGKEAQEFAERLRSQDSHAEVLQMTGMPLGSFSFFADGRLDIRTLPRRAVGEEAHAAGADAPWGADPDSGESWLILKASEVDGDLERDPNLSLVVRGKRLALLRVDHHDRR
jgi:4-amino-4-deoxy-L-arabinose transferase-like glycosyltransferase